MESEELEIKSKQASKKDRTLIMQLLTQVFTIIFSSQGASHNCVVSYMVAKENSDSGAWFDSICSVNRPSICEPN